MTRDDLFRLLYGRYLSRMIRYFRQVFHLSEEDAWDLAHDSFIRFYKAMDVYRGEAQWALLETIARHVGYNRARSLHTAKRGGARTEPLDDGEQRHDLPDVRQGDPVESMIKAEQLQRIQQAIAELPKGQRQCVQLALEDRSQEEIAQELRISVVAVKSRIRDAKRALRERLGEEAPIPEE